MQKTARVLIVDDEEELVSALVERLEIRGVPVVGVTSGREALAKIKEMEFDLAVVDLKMPGLDGLDAIRAMKQEQPSLRCVLLTGHDSKEIHEEARGVGAMDCLPKPVRLEDILEVIQRVQPMDGSV